MSDDPTTRILAAIESLRTDIDGLRGEVGSLRTDMDGLRGEVGSLRTNGDGLRGEVGRLRGDMMERMERLQNAISVLRDDVTVNFHSGERVERRAQGAAEETRALAVQVTAMERQILRINARLDDLENRV